MAKRNKYFDPDLIYPRVSDSESVADPGFPRGGGVIPQGARQPTISPIFPENCINLEKFWPRVGASPGTPSDPPVRISVPLLNVRTFALTLK